MRENRRGLCASLALVLLASTALWFLTRGAPGITTVENSASERSTQVDAPLAPVSVGPARRSADELREPVPSEDEQTGVGQLRDDPMDDARPWAWSRVEARLKEDIMLSDAAAEQLRKSLIDWPSPLTPENSAMHLNRGLSQAEIQQLEVIVMPFNRQLEAIADSYVAEIRGAQERLWAEQRYEVESRAITEGVDAPSEPGLSVHEYPGWRVSYRLPRDEFPKIRAFDERIKQLKWERLSNVQAAMRGF